MSHIYRLDLPETLKLLLISAPTRIARRLTLPVLCLVFCARVFATAPAQLLPTNCYAFLTIPKPSELAALTGKIPIFQAGRGDGPMKPLLDKLQQRIRHSMLDSLESELGLVTLIRSAEGPLAVAALESSDPAVSNRVPAVVLLVDSGTRSNALTTALENSRHAWEAAGKLQRKETISTREFSVVSLTNAGAILKKLWPPILDSPGSTATNTHPQDSSFQVLVGQAGPLLLVANSSRALADILACAGSHTNVARLADTREFGEARIGNSTLHGWVNLRALARVINQWPRFTGTGGLPERWGTVFKSLGFGEAESASISLQPVETGLEVQAFVDLPGASRTGLLGLFSNGAKDLMPPEFIPANARSFQRWRLNGRQVWGVLEQAAGQFSPPALRGLNFLLETAEIAARMKDPQFNLRSNLLTNLGDDLMICRQSGTNTLNPQPETLLLLQSPRPDQLAITFKSILLLLSAAAETPTESEVLGRKLYSFALPAVGVPGLFTIPQGASLHYSASTQHLAIATAHGILADYFRNSDAPVASLRGIPGFLTASQQLSAKASLYGYENDRQNLRSQWPSPQQNPAALIEMFLPQIVASPLISLFPENTLREWLDPSLIPPFEKVEHYFDYHLYAAGRDEKGLWFRFLLPVRPFVSPDKGS